MKAAIVFIGGPFDGRLDVVTLAPGEPGATIHPTAHGGPGCYLRETTWSTDGLDHYGYYWSPRGPMCEDCRREAAS